MVETLVDFAPLLAAAQSMADDAQHVQRQLHALMDAQYHDAAAGELTSREEFFPTLVTSEADHSHRPNKNRATTAQNYEKDSQTLQLLSHQRDGVRWLLALHELHLHGIVADEMGLGKTIQVVAFFAALAKRGTLGTYLIVAPLSTLDNWQREVRRWLPWMHVTLFTGTHAQRSQLRLQLRRRHRRAFQRREELRQRWCAGVSPVLLAHDVGGVVLTSYEAVMQDHGAVARMLRWDVTVVDEAHRLKNVSCKLLRTLRKADCPMRLILTGTPLQNNLEELWTLLEYVAPHLFCHGDISQRDARAAIAALSEDSPVLYGGTESDEDCVEGASSKDSGDGECKHAKVLRRSSKPSFAHGVSSEAAVNAAHHQMLLLQHLKTALRPFMLRRTKVSAGIPLPPKYDVYVPTPLTPAQEVFYHRVSTEERYAASRLTHLRKCCIHPRLFHEFSAEMDEQLPSGCDRGEQRLHDQLEALLSTSGKLRMLDAMLPRLRQRGHRVLLFSQMTKALDLVEEYLALKNQIIEFESTAALTSAASCATDDHIDGSTNGDVQAVWSRLLPYTRLDGTSSTQERCEAIRLFQASVKAPLQKGSDVLDNQQRLHGCANVDPAGGPVSRDDNIDYNLNGVVEKNHIDTGTAAHRKRQRALSRDKLLHGVAEDDAIFDDSDSFVPSAKSPVVPRCEASFLSEKSLNENFAAVPFKPQGTMKQCYANLITHSTLPKSACQKQENQQQRVNLITVESATAMKSTGLVEAVKSTPTESVPPPTSSFADIFLFLISTRAGGAGLNLTAADTVILLDGDFNPHNDLQAVDRCHRIGQTRPVAVYRLVCPRTVEDARHLRIVEKKMHLDGLILEDGEGEDTLADKRPLHAAQLLHSATPPKTRSRSTSNKGGQVDELTSSQVESLLDRTWLQQAWSISSKTTHCV